MVVAGNLTDIDGLPARHIAHFVGQQWAPMGQEFETVPTAVNYSDQGVLASDGPMAGQGESCEPVQSSR